MAKESVLPLKAMPDDVRRIVLRTQYEFKIKKGISQFSLPTTIYAIIREWDILKIKKQND